MGIGDTDAVILVGGQGTRLRPLTLSTAKPMLPTAGVPFLAHMLSRIHDAGLRHVVLGTSYRAETFADYFGDGSAMGLHIEYAVEDEPLGTGGAIRNVAGKLRGERALVFNGDILSGLDLVALHTAHMTAGADVTLHLVRVADPRRFGSVPTDPDGKVTAFLEKTDNPPTDQINAGCYLFEREIIEALPSGRVVSVERETFPGLLAAGAHVHGFVDSSYWLDLGTPAAFVRGSADLVQGIAPSGAVPTTGSALIADDARVDDTAIIDNGATISARCVVGAEARIDGSVLLDGATVAAGAHIIRSVVGYEAVIGSGTVIEDAVIGDRARIGTHCELQAGARIWPGVEIPDGAIRFSPGV